MKVKTRLLRQLHIYSSLFCCTILLIFGLTGISLNHRELVESEPVQLITKLAIKQHSLASLTQQLTAEDLRLSVSDLSSLYQQREFSRATPGRRLEIYIEDDQIIIEQTNMGLVSRLNELHQNRYTSMVWTIASDSAAVIFIVIAATGIWLSLRDKKQRRNYLICLVLSIISFILLME